MKKLVFLLVCLILFIIGIILFNHFNYSQDKIKKLQPVFPLYEQISDLDLDGKNEIIEFYSSPVDLTGGNTDIFINKETNAKVSLSGYFQKSDIYDIAKDVRVLEVQTNLGGKLINSIILVYQNGELTRIPIFDGVKSLPRGIFSSGGIEFKDYDSDGILEMFVYHRHYPPEAKRTVEIYQFTNQVFKKVQEYEESTPNVYL